MVGCLAGSKGVALAVIAGVGVEQVRGADDTASEITELQFWVGQGCAGNGLERTTAVLGVVGGETTV